MYSGLKFPSCMGWFVFVAFGVYFILIRGNFARFVIKDRTSKEHKKHIDELFDRTLKEHLIAFGRWILCMGYPDERKKKGYRFFVFFNYLYLFICALFLIIWILAFFIEGLQILCIKYTLIKMKYIDAPFMVIIAIMQARHNLKKQKKNKWRNF